jgi:hypothetical protein
VVALRGYLFLHVRIPEFYPLGYLVREGCLDLVLGEPVRLARPL